MSDTAIHCGDPRFAFAPSQRDLPHRIRWICHALRIAAVLWITWNLTFVVYYWSDKAQVLRTMDSCSLPISATFPLRVMQQPFPR